MNNRYLEADAAMYIAETLRLLDEQKQLFISRVPLNIKDAKELVSITTTMGRNLKVFPACCHPGVVQDPYHKDVNAHRDGYPCRMDCVQSLYTNDSGVTLLIIPPAMSLEPVEGYEDYFFAEVPSCYGEVQQQRVTMALVS